MTRSQFIFCSAILIGSLLPDIIDKPVGMFLWSNIFGYGRIFSHTLLFSLLLFAGGSLLYLKSKQNWLLWLGCGSVTHLALDQMWLTPDILFWPLTGAGFEGVRISVSDWLSGTLFSLVRDPGTYIPELLGLGILIAFLIRKVGLSRHTSDVAQGQQVLQVLKIRKESRDR